MFNSKPATQMEPDAALPGRDEPIEVEADHVVLGTPIVGPWPEGHEVISFGMGCFWGAERIFWKIPGVYTTAVGYQGGYTPNPNYREVCTGQTGHAEVALVVYDPAEVELETILKEFWEQHDPTTLNRQGNDVGTQYRSAISGEAHRAGLWSDHDRDHRRSRSRAVLLRRGLPPGLSPQEPDGLLQPRLLPSQLRVARVETVFP